MFVTVKMLQDHRACQDQVDLFAATFPDGVRATAAVCLAVSDKFDWGWAAGNLLPLEAWAEYEAKRASIRVEYRQQQQAALFGRITETVED